MAKTADERTGIGTEVTAATTSSSSSNNINGGSIIAIGGGEFAGPLAIAYPRALGAIHWQIAFVHVDTYRRRLLVYASVAEFEHRRMRAQSLIGADADIPTFSLNNTAIYYADFILRPFAFELSSVDGHHFFAAANDSQFAQWIHHILQAKAQPLAPIRELIIYPVQVPLSPSDAASLATLPQLMYARVSSVEYGKHGYLQKRGVFNPAFQTKFFRTTLNADGETVIAYYATAHVTSASGVITLNGARIEDLDPITLDFSVATAKRVYILRAPSRSEKRSWLTVLRSLSLGEADNAIDNSQPFDVDNDFFSMLNVPNNATQAEIISAFSNHKKRWRRLGDNPGERNTVNLAFNVLCDPIRRYQYDVLRQRITTKLKSLRAQPISHQRQYSVAHSLNVPVLTNKHIDSANIDDAREEKKAYHDQDETQSIVASSHSSALSVAEVEKKDNNKSSVIDVPTTAVPVSSPVTLPPLTVVPASAPAQSPIHTNNVDSHDKSPTTITIDITHADQYEADDEKRLASPNERTPLKINAATGSTQAAANSTSDHVKTPASPSAESDHPAESAPLFNSQQMLRSSTASVVSQLPSNDGSQQRLISASDISHLRLFVHNEDGTEGSVVQPLFSPTSSLITDPSFHHDDEKAELITSNGRSSHNTKPSPTHHRSADDQTHLSIVASNHQKLQNTSSPPRQTDIRQMPYELDMKFYDKYRTYYDNTSAEKSVSASSKVLRYDEAIDNSGAKPVTTQVSFVTSPLPNSVTPTSTRSSTSVTAHPLDGRRISFDDGINALALCHKGVTLTSLPQSIFQTPQTYLYRLVRQQTQADATHTTERTQTLTSSYSSTLHPAPTPRDPHNINNNASDELQYHSLIYYTGKRLMSIPLHSYHILIGAESSLWRRSDHRRQFASRLLYAFSIIIIDTQIVYDFCATNYIDFERLITALQFIQQYNNITQKNHIQTTLTNNNNNYTYINGAPIINQNSSAHQHVKNSNG